MPAIAVKDSEVGKLFLAAEEKIKSEPTYDLATLNACHQFWEFVALTDLEFDAWLHAHIKKAIQAEEKK